MSPFSQRLALAATALWVALSGTSLTETLPAQASKNPGWWSLRPLTDPAPPRAAAAGSGKNEIDAFLHRRLRQAGLSPSPAADRVTLIRRLTFDLHGLPPTPQEIAAFVADRTPDAYDALVERLLASPRYGERWARHWLDVVHFGETHGYDKDKLREHAWPYRDYVIRSFNSDKPYTQFVQEQLAGDVLVPRSPDGIIATGFIAAGPWDFVGHVELREGTIDKKITRLLDRDDMVMNTISTFVSTTAHCARCHDHKFDPIPQADYYRLQAVFAGVERADRPAPDPEMEKLRAECHAAKEKNLARIAAIHRIRDAATNAAVVAAEHKVEKLRQDLTPVEFDATKPSRTLGYHSAIANSPDVTKWVAVDLGREVDIEGIVLLPAHVRFGGHDGPGFGFPRRFAVAVATDESMKTGRTLRAESHRDFANPGDRPVFIDGQSARARYVRVTATRLWKRTGDWVFALSELIVFSGGRNVAAGARVISHDSIEAMPSWSRKNLVDGHSSRKRLHVDTEIFAASEDQFTLARRIRECNATRENALDPRLRKELDQLQKQAGILQRMLDRVPAAPLVYAAATQFKPIGRFKPRGSPRPVHVLERGEIKRPREKVTAGALSALPRLARHFPSGGDPEATQEGVRRLSLARWITDPDNPLTWRSIVNRVWQYHFGRGLVTTPNDFGRMGAKPSHPELLDWLAARFRDRGSFKDLHRRIVKSAAYRQASAHRAGPAKTDVGNRLLWRMNRRRLEAESLRDAVLSVSGKLDLTMGGPSARHFAFEDDESPRYLYAKFDVDSPASRRRSIYRLAVRSVADPFMERLDCPDASLLTPTRYTTITAPQALALLNNRFMVRYSEHFAHRITNERTDPRARIELAFRLAFGRSPRAAETAAFLDITAKHGLEIACRTILNTNEFLFID